MKGAGYFENLFYSGVISAESPGYIGINARVSIVDNFFQQRFVCCSEEIFIFLQNATIDLIGKKKASDLWYRIGKELSIRYFLFFVSVGQQMKMPFNSFDSLMKHLEGVGWSFAADVFFDKEKLSLVLRGANNPLCNKTSDSSFFLGIISGYMTFLFNQNIEAVAECCCCPKNCKIVASPEIETRCLVDMKSLEISKDYFFLNLRSVEGGGLHSFNDFVKFKKITFKENYIYFLGRRILLFEIGALNLFLNNYEEVGLRDFMEETVIGFIENSWKSVLNDSDLESRVVKFRNVFSVLGYGIMFLRQEGKDINLKWLNPPFSKYGVDLEIFVINGLLNLVFGKKYVMKEKKEDFSNFSIDLLFVEK